MAVTPAQFRSDFKEFADPEIYPDSVINFWVGIAVILLTATTRWDTLLDHGTELIVAHHIALAQRDLKSAQSGGMPGTVYGILSSKHVDKVSASYDAKSVTLSNAGFWNMTTYGIQFWQLAGLMGAGGIQLGGGNPGPYNNGIFGDGY